MALSECRRFPTLSQALVAQSALRAAGVRAFVFDEFRASVVWTEQFALGGVRVMVPADDLAAAEVVLGPREAPEAAAEPAPARIGQVAGLLALLPLAVVVGWPLAGFRRTGLFHRATALVLTVGAVVVTAWLLAHRGRAG